MRSVQRPSLLAVLTPGPPRLEHERSVGFEAVGEEQGIGEENARGSAGAWLARARSEIVGSLAQTPEALPLPTPEPVSVAAKSQCPHLRTPARRARCPR